MKDMWKSRYESDVSLHPSTIKGSHSERNFKVSECALGGGDEDYRISSTNCQDKEFYKYATKTNCTKVYSFFLSKTKYAGI